MTDEGAGMKPAGELVKNTAPLCLLAIMPLTKWCVIGRHAVALQW